MKKYIDPKIEIMYLESNENNMLSSSGELEADFTGTGWDWTSGQITM